MAKELTNKEITALEKLMLKFLDNEDAYTELEDSNKEIGKLILEALMDADIKSYPLEYETDERKKPFKCTFTVANRAYVNYKEEEIKKIIGKKLFAEIVDREINVDYEKYVALMKKYNIPYKEGMSCITIFDKINSRKLEQAYSSGRIDLEKLKGTYTVDNKPYLTHRRSK